MSNQVQVSTTTAALNAVQDFLSAWPQWIAAYNWDIWTPQFKLKSEVSDWLDEFVGPDHWDCDDLYGILVFNDLSATTYFKLRFE